MTANENHHASGPPGKSDSVSRIPCPYVPGIFYGTVDAVSAAWRPVFRRVLREHSLKAVVAHSRPVSILKSPGNIILHVEHGWNRGVRGENYHFGECLDFLVETVPAAVLARLLDEHADEFWVAAMVASSDMAVQTLFNHPNPNLPKTASIILNRLLRWWPELCRLGDRFSLSEQFSEEILSVSEDFRQDVKNKSGWRLWGRSAALAFSYGQTRPLAAGADDAMDYHCNRIINAGPTGAQDILQKFVDQHATEPEETLESVMRTRAASTESGGDNAAG